ncbi:hypothetical protein FRUB_08316 [Fimbriiglobus ruber]|uniref:Uncharacterized protein n=1 Tax=Fimbriiglobus ruber TaxID=1908690 RepID=A0A225D480_9BACT|nr:hypothetical protein FRUB_08316 [Fimbriiglobus ruber]
MKSFVFSGGCGLCNPTNTGKHGGFQAFLFFSNVNLSMATLG